MNAFIVRPFGQKNGIDFDAVEAELIRPALEQVEIPGGTTAWLVHAGNIRTDMFEQLLLADIVIADISIHNANVFYELGIRHGLRDKRTILIRSEMDEVPFDLRTDRYISYDKAKPSGAIGPLVETLRATVKSERRDSPVFLLLPDLEPQRREAFLIVPEDFGLEVEKARERRAAGDLALLAAEARGFQWELAGLRIVARAQIKLNAHRGARATWERVVQYEPDDLEANLCLGTIYQRLGEPAASDHAVRKALEAERLPTKRAEAHALLGRNAKTRWRAFWEPSAEPKEAALQSDFLGEACEHYGRGFMEDQNHFYSGINALGLLTVRVELARALPATWDAQFDTSEEAQSKLATLESERTKLAAAVEHSLAAAAKRLERVGEHDIWLEFSKADFRCLTTRSPERAAAAYERILGRAYPFDIDAARRQLELYKRLGVVPKNVAAALAVLPPLLQVELDEPLHVFLFTGHQTDSPGREHPRFPADREPIARAKIKEALESELAGLKGRTCGLAGAASGGDILFHEVCGELGIATEVFLALPENPFINQSVAPAGANWVKRFRTLMAKQAAEAKEANRPLRPPLTAQAELPTWLSSKKDYDIWQRNNLWMLHNAVAVGGKHTTLIALWNGEGGDGPGGTKDMIEQAGEMGARTIIIDTKKEFAL